MKGRARAVRISVVGAPISVAPVHCGPVSSLRRTFLMNRRRLFKLAVGVVLAMAVLLFCAVNITDVPRTYKKLALGVSTDLLISSKLSMEPHSHRELMDKHTEAARIHAMVASASVDSDSNAVVMDRKTKQEDKNVEKLAGIQDIRKRRDDRVMLKEQTKFSEHFPTAEEMTLTERHNFSVNNSQTQRVCLLHKHKDKSNDSQSFNFKTSNLSASIKKMSESGNVSSSAIHLCVVMCGERGEEAFTMLKSVSMVTPIAQELIFYIFTEPDSQQYIQDELELWPLAQRQRISYFIYNVTFPESTTTNAWRKLFKPCASQRLFLPELLKDVDRLIYVDTDVIFLESLAHLWSHFDLFNSTQLTGLVSEAEAWYTGWYNRFANHPFYGKYGLNSGVMLMDLARLRQTSWLSDIQRLFQDYELVLTWGDQDLINIYLACHPDQMYLLPCKWNYRTDHCHYGSVCKSAEADGASLLHGSRRAFETNREPIFKTIYSAFVKYELGDDMEHHFLSGLRKTVKSLADKHVNSTCMGAFHIFFKQLNNLRQRNREFMQASRKANEKLVLARKKARADRRHPNISDNHHEHDRQDKTLDREMALKDKSRLQESSLKRVRDEDKWDSKSLVKDQREELEENTVSSRLENVEKQKKFNDRVIQKDGGQAEVAKSKEEKTSKEKENTDSSLDTAD